MIAFVVAGLIVGALFWLLKHSPEDPALIWQLLFGAVGAALGGGVPNAVRSKDFLDVDAFSFTAAVLVAVIVIGLLQAGVGRKPRDPVA